MLLNYKISVIFPAAGIGERTGMPIPKQYMLVAGLPLYRHTINTFLRCSLFTFT